MLTGLLRRRGLSHLLRNVMYLRTELWPNGTIKSPINYYKCDITGEEICECHGWYGNKNIHISESGMEILIEEWIKKNSNLCGVPIILYYLEQRLTNKIKPNRYISKSLRKKVLLKYKHKCNYCGSTENLEIDHINPVSKGGLNQFKNLQVLCKSCNINKSNK